MVPFSPDSLLPAITLCPLFSPPPPTTAKRTYRTRVESSYHGSEPRRMWSGLRAITDYKGRGCSETQSSVLLPDELNAFYARFEKDSDPPAVELPDGLASGVPTLTVAEHCRHCFKKTNPHKAQMPFQVGPSGVVLTS